ncbi:Uncharacterised protein [Enterobacter ludwigii]|nr:Uncharacterised protein [Enterobacter ludwigii]
MFICKNPPPLCNQCLPIAAKASQELISFIISFIVNEIIIIT